MTPPAEAGQNVLMLQHVSFEGPGAIAPWLIARGHRLTVEIGRAHV